MPCCVRIVLLGGSASPIKREREVQAGRGEKNVMRQDPEPVADIQSREKSRETGRQIEIGKAIVDKFRQPDLSGYKITGFSCYFLRGAEGEIIWCGFRQHASSFLMVTFLMKADLSLS